MWPMTFKFMWDTVNVTAFTKFQIRISDGSAVRALIEGQTHRWTDRRDRFYTLEHWHGREKLHDFPDFSFHAILTIIGHFFLFFGTRVCLKLILSSRGVDKIKITKSGPTKKV